MHFKTLSSIFSPKNRVLDHINVCFWVRLIFGFVEPRLENPMAPVAPLGTSLVSLRLIGHVRGEPGLAVVYRIKG